VGSSGYSVGDYDNSFGGTSAACPYAAGAAACLQSAAMASLGSYLSPEQIQSLLSSTGDLIPDPKTGITKPRINLEAAIASVVPSGIVVSPTVGMNSIGDERGPFTPENTTYQVLNSSDASIDYMVTKTVDWITLDDGNTSGDDPLTGTLPAGANVNIAVIINEEADFLSAGSYSDTITFKNITNSRGNTTRLVNLKVSDALDALCECDLNHDRRCDMQDWLLFLEDWGRADCNDLGNSEGLKKASGSGGNRVFIRDAFTSISSSPCECDLNRDGTCDTQDLLLFIEDRGRTDCPTP
jgi:hypothetical protein